MSSKRRFKPKPPTTKSTPTTMEDTTITLPKMEDWDVKIGSLWNCRTSQHSSDNIFQQIYLEDDAYLEVIPTPDMQYTLNRARDATEKSELLDISVEVKLELPAFSVEGSVSFRKEDEKHFEQEEFFVQYNAQTSLLRTRASVQDPKNHEGLDSIINPDVLDRIADGTTDVTHYVSEIRYGGWAKARFRLSDKLDHNLLDLSGSVGGTVPVFPGISVGLKASIAFMDQDTKLHYSKEIHAEGSPLPPPEGNINKMADMFAYVEKLPGAINDSKQPFPADGSLKGVALTFKLTPLSYLISMGDGYQKYNLLEAELLQELQDTIFSLNDFQMPDRYRSLIREMDTRLIIMFPNVRDEDGVNPWAKKVDDYQKQLDDRAVNLGKETSDTFQRYKLGMATTDDIKYILKEFGNDPICHPTKVKAMLQVHVKEGKDILNILRPADATVAGQPELFIFNSAKWGALKEDHVETSIKVLITTSGEIPLGFFKTFYSMIPIAMAALPDKLMFRVAAPNIDIEAGFSLILKYGIKSAYTYNGVDVIGMLKLLDVIARAKTKQNTNTSRFYSTYTAVNGEGPAEHWDLGELDAKYTTLKTQFDSIGLIIANNYLQTLEALTDGADEVEWTLFLPIQFLTSMHDSMFYFKLFISTIRASKTTVSYRTVVGYFDSHGETGDAPLMIVLDRNGFIVSVCFDQLDLLLLGHKFTTDGTMILESLELDKMGVYQLAPFRVDTAIDICNIIAEGDKLKIVVSNDNPFLNDKGVEINPWFVLIREILEAATFQPFHKLVNCFCKIPAELIGGKLISVLQKNGWDRQIGFQVGADKPVWGDLLLDLQTLKGNLDEGIEEKDGDVKDEQTPLDQLINVVDYASNPSPIKKLYDCCLFYIDMLFNYREGTEGSDKEESYLTEEIRKDLKELLVASNEQLSTLLKSLQLLQLTRCNENYYLFWKTVDNICKFSTKADNTANMTTVLELVAKFESEEQKWIWNNPRFQYWTSLFLNSKSELAKMYKLYVPKNILDEDVIPPWFPLDHRKQLLAVYELVENPLMKWNGEIWDSVEVMLNAFATLIVNQNVPHNFTHVLGHNMVERPELLEALKSKDCLEFWNDIDSHFTAAWGMTQITNAFEKLQSIESFDVSDTRVIRKAYPIKANTSPTKLEDDVLEMNSKWYPYTGGTMKRFSIHDFLTFQPSQYFLPLIMLDDESLATSGEKILSYIISQIKQGNSTEVLDDSKVIQYLDYYEFKPIEQARSSAILEGSVDDANIWSSCFRVERRSSLSAKETSGENQFYLSRSDLLTLLLNCGDQFVRNEMLLAISRQSPFLHALPWFIPDITKEDLKTVSLSEAMCMIDLNEYFENSPIKMTCLLNPPYKLIVAIRAGPFKYSNLGKSTLLNNTVLKRCTFSTKFEAGYQHGPPVSRDGLVELAWLSEFTAKDEFYTNYLKKYYEEYNREMVLIANVHGDVKDMPRELIKYLRRFSGTFLIFWGCSSWKEMIAYKPDLDVLLGKNSTVYNLVVDPDLSIRKNVNEEVIIETDKDNDYHYKKMEAVMKNLIETTNSTTELLEEDNKLVRFIETSTVQCIRRAFKLQNHGEFQDSESEALRDKILSDFIEILSKPDTSERNIILWKIDRLLRQLSSQSNSEAIKSMSQLSQKYPEQEDSKDFIVAALRASRHELNLNSLSLTNLFRELTLEYADSDDAFLSKIQDIFSHGFPLEFLNMNFTSLLDKSVLNCFDYLEKEGIKFLTVSAIGPQGSHKSTILNKLFVPGLGEGPFGTTNGTVMRLVKLAKNKPQSLEDIDAILLLDSEGIGRTDNALDIESVQLQRQMVALILAISDICLVTYGGDSAADWLSSLQGVMELTFLAQSTLFKEPSFPDIILVGEDPEEEQVPERNDEFREMLKSVSNITTQYPMQTLAKHATIEGLQSTYTRVLSDSLQHNLPPLKTEDFKENKFYSSIESLRNKVVLSGGEAKPSEGAAYLSKINSYWEVITEHKSQFSTPTAFQISQQLNHNNLISLIKTSYETAYAGHEELLEDTDPNETLDFSGFNGIPYFCPRLDEDVCDCKEQLGILERLEGQLLDGTSGAKLKLIQNDLDNYTKQLRSDVMSRMTQERYATQIAKGTQDGELDKVLKKMVKEDPNPWVPFKQYVASLLNVSAWDWIIQNEIRNEYGNQLLEDIIPGEHSREIIPYESLEAFDLQMLGNWNQSPLDISERVEELGNFLGWEEFIWLEIEIEKEITRGSTSYSGYGYKRGMLRRVRDKVDQLLGGTLRSKLPTEFELSSKFISDVHFLAVKRFVDYWKEQWEIWLPKWNPLTLLEGKKDLFPDRIFVGEKPEVDEI